MHTGFWCGKLRERGYVEEPVDDGTVIIKRIFKKLCGWVPGIDPSRSGYEQVSGCCEFGNKLPVFIKCEEFLG